MPHRPRSGTGCWMKWIHPAPLVDRAYTATSPCIRNMRHLHGVRGARLCQPSGSSPACTWVLLVFPVGPLLLPSGTTWSTLWIHLQHRVHPVGPAGGSGSPTVWILCNSLVDPLGPQGGSCSPRTWVLLAHGAGPAPAPRGSTGGAIRPPLPTTWVLVVVDADPPRPARGSRLEVRLIDLHRLVGRLGPVRRPAVQAVDTPPIPAQSAPVALTGPPAGIRYSTGK